MKNFTLMTLLFLSLNLSAANKKNPKVLMKTTLGDITIELYPDKAPATVKNFLKYVDSGFYKGTIFHRVINGFMIQGGGFTKDMKKKEAIDTVKNEADNGLKNETGTIAMARTNEPHSASSQFFINVNDNSSLNHTSKTPMGWGYAVFGKVIKGMPVVNQIKKTKTKTMSYYQNVPVAPIIITEVKKL